MARPRSSTRATQGRPTGPMPARRGRPQSRGSARATDARATTGDLLQHFDADSQTLVYRLSPAQALVESFRLLPRLVADPRALGRVAAASALSDVWALGAKALFARALLASPPDLPQTAARALLAGVAETAAEAGLPIMAGQSFEATELRCGLAVTGLLEPGRMLASAAARPGDALVLTKPVGTGIAATAMARGHGDRALERRVLEQLATLNLRARDVFAGGRFAVHALTAVSGHGLLGEALVLARAAGAPLVVQLEQVPVLSGVAALAEAGHIPSATEANLASVQRWVRFPQGLPKAIRLVLADAQTNGGLLAAVPRAALSKLLQGLARANVDAWVIGEFGQGKPGVTVA